MATTVFSPSVPEYTYNQSGVIAVNTNLFWVDLGPMADTSMLAFHVVSMGTSGQVALEFSADDTNWVNGQVARVDSSAPIFTSSFSGSGLYAAHQLARYMRFRLSAATTAGTTKIVLYTSNIASNPSVVVANAAAMGGSAAVGSAAAGSPVRLGLVANTSLAIATAGNMADMAATQYGVQVARPFSIPEYDWSYAAPAGGITTNVSTLAKAAGGAGLRNYVTGMTVRNANAVATEFVILDGATIIWRDYQPASQTAMTPIQFPTPLRGTAATALNIQALTTGAQIYCNLQGYTAP